MLSVIDDKGIKALRKHQLVWSSWLVFQPHFENFAPMLPNHGYRKINNVDSEALIRFALSIAWRTSASSLPDMKDITLEKSREDELKEYVLGRPIEGTSSFPVSMIQISTVGETHNLSPYIDNKQIFGIEGSQDISCKIMRIYVDGLVFHVHLSPIPNEHLMDNPVYLGSSDHTFVTSVTYDASFQYENMLHLMRECHPSIGRKN